MPSSVIQYFSYLPASKILRVVFRSGIVYDYKGVSDSVYQKMKAAASKGRFLNEKIKGKFPFEKISADQG
jgi:hypothetical protein